MTLGYLIAMIAEELVTLFIILSYIAGFVVGLFVGVSFSKYRRDNARKAREARLAAADGKLRREGKERKIIALVIALVIVSMVIAFDHFKGPLFSDVFYSRE